MAIDVNELYVILREVARRGGIVSYEDLSRLYHKSTGEWHEPHGTWDVPLGRLNRQTNADGLPPISAVVTYKRQSEDEDWSPPGAGFWQSSPAVPPRPPTAEERLRVWYEFLRRVHAVPWPETLQRRKVYGRHIVSDPKICHGKLTFTGTRVFVQDVLEMVAEGMEWDTIIKQWHGSISREAIAEAVRLAGRALIDHVDEYAQEAASA
jgi:uncharacterized protein (DUF433 family)